MEKLRWLSYRPCCSPESTTPSGCLDVLPIETAESVLGAAEQPWCSHISALPTTSLLSLLFQVDLSVHEAIAV